MASHSCGGPSSSSPVADTMPQRAQVSVCVRVMQCRHANVWLGKHLPVHAASGNGRPSIRSERYTAQYPPVRTPRTAHTHTTCTVCGGCQAAFTAECVQPEEHRQRVKWGNAAISNLSRHFNIKRIRRIKNWYCLCLARWWFWLKLFEKNRIETAREDKFACFGQWNKC